MKELIVISKDENTTLYKIEDGSHYSLELWPNEQPATPLAKVEIWKPEERFGGELKGAEVNWQAHGSVSPVAAARYAKMVELASKIAVGLNEQAGLCKCGQWSVDEYGPVCPSCVADGYPGEVS